MGYGQGVRGTCEIRDDADHRGRKRGKIANQLFRKSQPECVDPESICKLERCHMKVTKIANPLNSDSLNTIVPRNGFSKLALPAFALDQAAKRNGFGNFAELAVDAAERKAAVACIIKEIEFEAPKKNLEDTHIPSSDGYEIQIFLVENVPFPEI